MRRTARIISKREARYNEQQRRRSMRSKTLIAGEIIMAGRGRRVPCKILDMSATGARLAMYPEYYRSRAGYAGVSQQLGLVLDRKGTNVDCEVVWQGDGELGVRFRSPIHHGR